MERLRMFTRVLRLALLLGGAILAQTAMAAGYDAQIQQAESLIQKGDSAKAYALLEPLESRLAGNIRYDYLLGVSAVNSGKASRAVFALERAQAVNPDYRSVGLWLAIAYYESGDRERARAGFEAAASRGDAETRRKAERYLSTMDDEDAARHASLTGKIDIGFGHDSNITNLSPAYANAQQFAAAVPVPASNQSGLEAIVGVGVEGRLPLSGSYLFVSLNDERRKYINNNDMNSDTVLVKGGINIASGGDIYRVSATQRQFRQLGAFYNITGFNNDYIITGGEGVARFKLSEGSYFGLLAQFNQVRFDVNTVEDTNQAVAGANYMHIFQAAGSPVFYLGYARYDDKAVRPKAAYNLFYNEGLTDAGKTTDVATLFLQYSLSSDLNLISTNFYYFRQDTGAYARSATVAYGQDKIRYLSLGANWRFRPKWTMRALLAKTANDSNIAVYSYSKTEATLIFRREFN